MSADWDPVAERQAEAAAHESAQKFLAAQPTWLAAAAGEGPGGTHPVAAAYWDGKLPPRSVYNWARQYQEDPAGIAAVLDSLAAVLDRPQPVIAGAGYVSHHPRVSGSPVRTSTGYRNAVEELRLSVPGAIAAAEASGEPAPELFPGWGDGPPPETASGLSPAMFAALPWRAKLAGVWEPNRSTAFKLALRFSEPDGAQAAWDEFHGRGVVGDHELGVEHWARTAGVDPLTPGRDVEEDHQALWPEQRQQ